MDVIRYGQYFPRNHWDKVRAGLFGAIRDIENMEGGPDTLLHHPSFLNSFIFLVFYGPGSAPIGKWEALKVVQTIKGIFFVYRYNPREITVVIKMRRLPNPVQMTLHWMSELPKHWEDHLPWTIDIGSRGLPRIRKRQLTFYEYGKYTDDPSLANVVREALGWFITDFTNEGRPSELINEEAYYHAFVKLYIQSTIPGEPKITRAEMIDVVDSIRTLCSTISNNNPREFRAHLEHSPYFPPISRIGTITLEFMDSTQGARKSLS